MTYLGSPRSRGVSSAILAVLLALALAVLLAAGPFSPARALTSEERLVEEARLTILSMLGDPNYEIMQPYLASAEGVLILPDLYRGGFIFGAEGGEGVLLVRREDGGWSHPAFYFMGGGSFGLQIGGQISETVLTIMTARGVDALINRRVRVGADLSGAIVAVGGGIEAGSALDLDADLYAFSRTQGLFAGLSLEGAVIHDLAGRNENYYGSGATPRAIFSGQYSNSHADALRAALAP
ncbi:MAG: hypothetical protein GVY13_17850 [Alphaproteobacteria bacterium]|jgi:lipid-binding SYLF domain-containing protein|nr:hypothetical protein [Alphaproteobacteria bacterium]